MSWSSSYNNRYLDGPRGSGTYGSSSRSGNAGAVWDSHSSQAPETNKMRMMQLERARLLERERERRENARMLELKQKAMVMEQEKAIMLEREKLKRMEEDAERMRMARPSSDGTFSMNKMADRFGDSYGSSSGSGRPFGDEVRRTSSYNFGSTFENEKGFRQSPPTSRMTMSSQRSSDVWDSRGGRSTFEKAAPTSWTGNQGFRDDARKKELEFEMRRSRLPEKRGFLDRSYEQSDMSKRSKVQDDWSFSQRGSFRNDSFDRSGSKRGSFGNRSEERMKYSKDFEKPMFKSPPRYSSGSFVKDDASMNRRSAKGPPVRSTARPMGSRSDVVDARRMNKRSPANPTPVWDTGTPKMSSAAALTPQLLRNIEMQARKLIQEDGERPQQLPLRKVREVARDVGFRGGDRSRTGPVRRFQDSRGNKIIQAKRLDSAYNNKTFQGKFSQRGREPIKSGTGLNSSKTTSIKKDKIKKVVDAAKLAAEKLTKPYYCIFCKVQYKSKEPYRKHLEDKKHTAEVTRKERVLIDNMLDINKIAAEETRRSDNKKVCNACCLQFTGNFQKHCQSIIHASKTYKLGASCDICNKTFRRRSILDRHLAALQHARNLACSLRDQGKLVDSAEQLKYPETFDGKTLGMDFIKDVKCAQCFVCDSTILVKSDNVIDHAKSKEHHDNCTKYKKKVLAEKKAREEKLTAEKKAKEEKFAAERKARREKFEAEKKARREKFEAEKKARQERFEAEKKARQEKFAAEKKAKAEKLEAEKKAKAEKVKSEKNAKGETDEAEKNAKGETHEAEKNAKGETHEAEKNAKGETAEAEKNAKEVSKTDEQGTPKKSETTSKQTVAAKKQTVVAKKQTVAAKKPTVAAKKPTVAAKKQTVAAKKQTVAAKKQPVTPKKLAETTPEKPTARKSAKK